MLVLCSNGNSYRYMLRANQQYRTEPNAWIQNSLRRDLINFFSLYHIRDCFHSLLISPCRSPNELPLRGSSLVPLSRFTQLMLFMDTGIICETYFSWLWVRSAYAHHFYTTIKNQICFKMVISGTITEKFMRSCIDLIFMRQNFREPLSCFIFTITTTHSPEAKFTYTHLKCFVNVVLLSSSIKRFWFLCVLRTILNTIEYVNNLQNKSDRSLNRNNKQQILPHPSMIIILNIYLISLREE